MKQIQILIQLFTIDNQVKKNVVTLQRKEAKKNIPGKYFSEYSIMC